MARTGNQSSALMEDRTSAGFHSFGRLLDRGAISAPKHNDRISPNNLILAQSMPSEAGHVNIIQRPARMRAYAAFAPA
jgi:hypothetical protein